MSEIRRNSAPADMPHTLGEFQRHFAQIYPVGANEDPVFTVAKICEEIAELAEAVRALDFNRGYLLNEAADLFAWILRFQNLSDFKARTASHQVGERLETEFHNLYGLSCPDCEKAVCECLPFLDASRGRITEEAPVGSDEFFQGLLMPSERVRALFESMESRTISIGKEEFQRTYEMLEMAQAALRELVRFAQDFRGQHATLAEETSETLRTIQVIGQRQVVTNESIAELQRALQRLPSPARQAAVDVLMGLGTGGAVAIAEAIARG